MMWNNITGTLKKKPYITAIFISAFVLAVYLPTMNTFLMSDDFEWLESSYSVWRNPSQLFELINNFFRPLIKFTYLLNYTLFKTDFVFYNGFTVLLHLVNIVLLFVLTFKITRRTFIAGLTAFTFGISAMYSEVTCWSAARTESVLLIFILAVLILMDNIHKKKVSRHAAVFLCTVLAAMSKESWTLLPFLAFCFLWIVKQDSIKTAFKTTAGLFFLLAIYLVYFIGVPILSAKRPPTAYGNMDIPNMVYKFGYMLYKYVGLGDIFNGAAWQFAALATVLAGILYLLIRRNNRVALFGFIWMIAMVGICLPVYYAPSRYNYLPLVGFWIMVTALLDVEIRRLAERFQLKKIAVGLVTGVALFSYTAYNVLMIQVEINDYHHRGALHKPLVDMYDKVKDRLPADRPIVFIDMGERRAVNELAGSIAGYKKLLFVREKAIWQQVFLSPLANFAGDPFKRLMEPIPSTELDAALKSDFTVLVFTDHGFFIPSTQEYKQKVVGYYRQYRQLPFKVEALRFVAK